MVYPTPSRRSASAACLSKSIKVHYTYDIHLRPPADFFNTTTPHYPGEQLNNRSQMHALASMDDMPSVQPSLSQPALPRADCSSGSTGTFPLPDLPRSADLASSLSATRKGWIKIHGDNALVWSAELEKALADGMHPVSSSVLLEGTDWQKYHHISSRPLPIPTHRACERKWHQPLSVTEQQNIRVYLAEDWRTPHIGPGRDPPTRLL